MRSLRSTLALGVLASLLAGACGEGDAPAGDTTATPPTTENATGGAQTGTDLQPSPGGKVVEVRMITDDQGSYFEPKEVEVKNGDVVRYVLEGGVHNVNFLPDSNAGATSIPGKPSEMFQLPGQKYDVKIEGWKDGSYFYQCDPHAALGMVGFVKVTGG